MSYRDNEWLKKYELKEPDLDFAERPYVGMRDVKYEPKRFRLEDGIWTSGRGGFKEALSSKKALLMFTGDMTCFDKQIEEAQNGEDYDFNWEFELLAPIFAQSDLAIGNLETVVCTDAPYRSEKIVIEENFYCNSPLEFLDAIRRTGIDMVTNANNHDIDAGTVGLGDTIDNMERFGFIHTGTFKDDRKRYEIVRVKGINVAITAFATDHNALECNITPDGLGYLTGDYTRETARDIYDSARKDGADAVIVCIHWGKENKSEVHPSQRIIAKDLAEIGYDCIIGSHPHVLQEYGEVVTDEKTVPVFYSMGNFVSHNVNNIKARSIIACVELKRSGKKVSVNCSYIPISTCESYNGRPFVVVPITGEPEQKRALSKLNRIKKAIGDGIEINTDVKYGEYKEEILEKEKKVKSEEPDLSAVTEFPVSYADGHFTYDIYEDHVIMTGVQQGYRSPSCTVPETVLELPVTGAADGAFEGNDHLKKIKFVSTDILSRNLCKNCKELEGFRMGLTAEVIEESAFEGCDSLYTIVLKRGMKRVEKRAFAGCTKIKTVKVPDGVEFIADDAFEGCDRAVFYCSEGSYGRRYALEHGFRTVALEMDLDKR